MMRNKSVWIGCAVLAVVLGVLAATHEKASAPLEHGVDRIVIEKRAHTMSLYRAGTLLHTYQVALGRGGLGPKLRAGDNRVPEGSYLIVGRNAHSVFHRALRIGYPTPLQTAAAESQGVDPGGNIMIHGIRNGLGWLGPLQRKIDWTKGCVAVTDAEIDQIWQAVPDGTRVEIKTVTSTRRQA